MINGSVSTGFTLGHSDLVIIVVIFRLGKIFSNPGEKIFIFVALFSNNYPQNI